MHMYARLSTHLQLIIESADNLTSHKFPRWKGVLYSGDSSDDASFRLEMCIEKAVKCVLTFPVLQSTLHKIYSYVSLSYTYRLLRHHCHHPKKY